MGLYTERKERSIHWLVSSSTGNLRLLACRAKLKVSCTKVPVGDLRALGEGEQVI